ncbi:MAG TPA: CHASE3 domain-containing protein, partial [Bacteroidota bacterium]|nr:CHASE3 domain-containing protein [Bacteroidota bacterium]
MKLSIGLKIGTGFGAAIIMVVAIAFVSLRGLKDFQDASAWREHTFQVIDQIERIRVLDSGTKTAIRDFALTGDSLCIRDHAVALARLIGRLPDLRELTADNPNQQHRIDLLSQAIAEKNAASMAYLPVLNGQRLPLAVVKTGVLQGAGARDSITAILSAMRDEEKKLLALREASVVVRSRNLTLILVAGSAAISAAMFLIFFFLTNHITGSLRELLRGTEAIERREFNERVAVRSHDELGDLGKSFNTMAAALADGEKAVQDFERLFSMSSDLICVSGYDGYFKR